MDEPNDVVMKLKAKLEEAEKNTIMAATYGKQLLDENHELHIRLEDTIKEYSLKLDALEQEKHDVTRKYETKVQNEQSLILELEHLREQQANSSKTKQNYEMEIQKLKKTVSSLTSSLENQQAENQQNLDHVALLEAQLKEAQEKRDLLCNISIHDQSVDDTTSVLQSQMMTLTCEKQELEKQLSTVTSELKTSKLKLSQAEKTTASLSKEVESLECQCTSYFNALEQNKEEIMELKMEIESLKLAETDPAKKGNSLFAEVEDQRQAMEKQLQEYKSKYNILKKQCEIKTQQISKMKLQLANLLSLSSNKADAEYLCNLEESLASARSQLEALTKHCQELELKQGNLVHPIQPVMENEATEEQNMTKFFKNMYMESQKKIEELDQTLQTARFDKVALSDRILQLQRKLRQVESTRDAANSKVITLQVKYEELAAKKGESVGNSSKDAKQATVKEKIPGFERNSICENKVENELQTPETEDRIPLQEVPVKSNTPQEVTSQTDVSSPQKDNKNLKPDVEAPSIEVTSANQENELALYMDEQKKKPKKSVRMTETVVVQEGDGEVQEINLKKDDGEKLPQPRKKILKKMTAPVVKVPSGGQPNDCNQQ